MGPIGFSTGAIAKGDFRAALSQLASTDADAVELSALRASELPDLVNAAPTLDLARYKYVSFHAPSTYGDERATVEVLQCLIDLHPGQTVNIVVHPDAIRDFNLWAPLNGSVCLENMDSRKPTGRTASELRRLFEKLPGARLCFDIGHAKQVDPSMVEAVRILRLFGDRVAQVHMSEVDTHGGHHAMTFAAIDSFRHIADLLPADVPIIMESVVHGHDDIVEEIRAARGIVSSESAD